MKTIFGTWTHFYWFLLLLILPSNSDGQVISVDEFLQTKLVSRDATETFSYDCPGKFYSSVYSDKHLSITYSQPRTINTEEGSKDIYDPRRVEIFNSQGKLLNILAEGEKPRVAGFIEGETDYYVFVQRVGGNHEIGIYDMEGNIVKSLNRGFYSYSSPQGKFYYNQGGESGLTIYNENGDKLFGIPIKGDRFTANAASDSTLLVVGRTTLAFWNINTQEIIWERNIPTKRNNIVDESSHIQFSMPGNIIALHSSKGYYCFNFQGDFLWADEDYGFGAKSLKHTGVSKSNGDVVVIYSKFNNQHSRFVKVFNNKGISLGEHEIQLGENVKFASTYSFTAVVYNDHVLIRIGTSTADQGIGFATCILYKENQSWSSAVVGGFWYFLNKDSQMERLIGYDSISRQVRGFQIK